MEDFKICLQRALLKASDASTDDIELLESELKRTERLAAKAKTKLKDYYQILGKLCFGSLIVLNVAGHRR